MKQINMNSLLLLQIFMLMFIIMESLSSQLSVNEYEHSCPNLISIVKEGVKSTLKTEPRMGASLLRLHFHDCFATGCDASILLDDTTNFTGEKTAAPNLNSARGFEVIDKIKAKVEEMCPGVVSCADILAMVARDSVVELGGPHWNVLLGRKDSTTANKTASNSNIIGPKSDLNMLIEGYANQGFTPQELVALSGGHTIGLAKCRFFKDRISDQNIDPSFKMSLKDFCNANGNNASLPLDFKTSVVFDNYYYIMLTSLRGLLHSDEQLFREPTRQFVEVYANNQTAFFEDFASAMVKMSKLGSLTMTGNNSGIIRKNCRNTLI